jgi:hypothetical protein
MAINSTVLLAEENRQLYYKNKRQKKKRAKKRTFIATRGVLTNQEGIARQYRSQVTNTVPEREVVTEEVIVRDVILQRITDWIRERIRDASTIHWCSAYDPLALSQRSSESLQTIYMAD